jgi:hypothetical protein
MTASVDDAAQPTDITLRMPAMPVSRKTGASAN